jgi:drug/metabolite transporter (DMT)-like permease
VTAFFVAPLAARLGERIPTRVLLGLGLALIGGGFVVITESLSLTNDSAAATFVRSAHGDP